MTVIALLKYPKYLQSVVTLDTVSIASERAHCCLQEVERQWWQFSGEDTDSVAGRVGRVGVTTGTS